MCFWGFRRLLLLLVVLSSSAGSFGEDGFRNSPSGVDESTGVVRVEGGPPGVVWVVQVSDIHINKWKPERGRALRRALGHALKRINPAVVLISGDLTDAKSKEKTYSRQYEDEWIEYQSSIQKVVDDSGIPLNRFNDLRGNHDSYGVPPSSMLDYFSKYSISAALNRSSRVQSVTVEGNDGRKHLFVGFDDSMTVGLRGPSNTFGHPTDDILEQLDQKLRRWENENAEGVTKIVYGHYPMSFTTSTETGKRPEEVMAKNDVTAYLCGHLHAKFGRRLYKRHTVGNKEFWEWEVGDWRSCRLLRVLAIDTGDTSFVDVELLSPTDQSAGRYIMPTFILQTYPLDSRFMLRGSGKTSNNSKTSNSIRTLVFSETLPVSVTARIFDFTLNPPKLVNESFMKLFQDNREESQTGPYYYTAPWESERYHHSSGFKYAMQITVESSEGSICYSDMRFFSVEGEVGEFHLTASAFIVFGFRWERAFPVLLWSMILFLVACLLIPKIFLYQLQKRGRYEEWVISVFTPASSTRAALVKIIKVPFWVMLEGARNNSLWAGMFTYMVYLIIFPWFSGRILGNDYPLGHMYIHGWTVKPFSADPEKTLSGLAIPDIMGIVLPYVYGVILPLLLILSALSAEKVACEFHITSLAKWQKKIESQSQPQSYVASKADAALDNGGSLSEGEITGSIKEEMQTHESDAVTENRGGKHDHCRLCERFIRKGLFLGCAGIAYNHWRFCSTMLGAYGPMVLVTGPAYVWGVPALLMSTLFRTSKVRSKPPRHEQ
ncbi:hypothetical protein KC19_12G126000 [Ceratodon purpureus]|uniref:Calcineurin-like phosphoesterase domain-containing protein n=1 Tax=Ceratodon purpureus TaxID=3225 RepID=A0A8T0GC89_CERPU|nr:hypothetical protein KC19_12G126000 [Ceratodon purpureus]